MRGLAKEEPWGRGPYVQLITFESAAGKSDRALQTTELLCTLLALHTPWCLRDMFGRVHVGTSKAARISPLP